MGNLGEEVDSLASSGAMSGVVSVSRGDVVEFERAYGLADRAHGIACTADTLWATASATKGFAALTVAALIADGALSLDTTARSLLGPDLPLIADDVTVGHLLAHTSGIGDYVDEDAEVEAPPRVPVQQLDSAEAYLPALAGFPTKFPAGSRFSYCNSGYAVLAVLVERAAAVSFHDLVEERVWTPAGMRDTAFLRSDELPGRAALGYLPDGRTNVFHLPVRGSGDGGAYSTVADFRRFWTALFAGRIVAAEVVRDLTTPRSDVAQERMRYGLGFWLHPTGAAVILEGCDHGVSLRSVHDPVSALTHTVVANTTDGAWPLARLLRDRLTG